jgi:ABC-type branched-subunit amino acid transport system substrate-binding protein
LHRHFARLTAAAVVVLGSIAAFAGAAPSPASAAAQPITIALITSLTGVAAPEYGDAPAGFRARIALQNAQGGINGHKIIPLVINDDTSPTTVVTAVQDAISKGALGIVSDSALFFAAAKYPQQQGVPVTGNFSDGPEWGTQPYTNMFAADDGSVDPKYPVNTGAGLFLKQHGGTVIGTYGYSISPSSTRSAIGVAKSFNHAGGKTGVVDTSVPFGGVDFTSAALTAKSKGVNAIWAAMDNGSNLALATSLKQSGVKLKAVVFPTGYAPGVINSPAWQAIQGDYFVTEFRPFSVPNAGTLQMAAALQKYQQFKKTDFPDFGQYESWLGADLMIKGIQKAGQNPSRTAVIKSLRSIKGYNGNGILPYSIDYPTIFGHDLPAYCAWYMQARPSGFVATSSQPLCGTDLPGSSTAQP